MGQTPTMHMRLLSAALCLMLMACDQATPTLGPSPNGSGGPAQSGAPGGTGGPPATFAPDASIDPSGTEPRTLPPLPIPTMTDPGAIGQALYDPAAMGDAVVSMLRLLGVTVYAADGSVVLPGGEATSPAVWLTAAEVWWLIDTGVEDLLGSEDGSLPWTLADLHDALEGSMADVSLEGFIAAFRETYADHPDDLAPQLLLNQPIDETVQLTTPQVWLLYLDGFVDLARQTAFEPGALLAASGLQFGTARSQLPPLTQPQSLSYDQWTQLKPHFMTIVATIPFEVYGGFGHEGHGGTGQPLSIFARIREGRSLTNPATGALILQAATGSLGGLAVRWTSPDVGVYARHGTLAQSIPGQGTTDAGGVVRITYTPQREASNGQGHIAHDSARIAATADVQDLFQHAYGLTDSSIIRFLVAGRIGGKRTVSDYTAISWHAKGIDITISNTYDVTVNASTGGLVAFAHRAGTDTWSGTIVRGQDGIYRGTLIAESKADAQMEFAAGVAGQRCEDSTNTNQLVDVVGHPMPFVGAIDPHLEALQDGAFGTEDLLLRFYPKTPPADAGRCQGVIDYFGPGPNGRMMRGAYISTNDSRFTDPAAGYRIHLPTSGLLVYEDRRLIPANLPPNTGVSSIFKIEITRDEGA